MQDVIGYIRLSKSSEGKGLSLDSQLLYIEKAAEQNGWNILAVYSDDGVSGSVALEDRPQGGLAYKHCLDAGVPLLVAKLDRLSRDVEHIARLMKALPLKVATLPNADAFQLHLFAALAEQERTFIRARTKDALKALQERADKGDADAQDKVERRNSKLTEGRKAGAPASLKVRQEKASQYAKTVEDALWSCKARGFHTLQSIADCLNQKGLTTPRGASFTAMTVSRLVTKLNIAL